MTDLPKLINVSDVESLRMVGCFLKPQTLYGYKNKGVYPNLFVKLGRKLFIKTDVWLGIIRDDLERQGVDFNEMFEGLKVANDEK